MQRAESAAEINGAEPFDYPESPGAHFVPSWNGWEEAPDAAGGPGAGAQRGGPGAREMPEPAKKAAGPEFERWLAEEARRSFEAGRARGVDEGRKAEREMQAEALAANQELRVRQTAELLERFAHEREQYLRAVEQEVVRLALAIAARVLRREAVSDPLLLMGAVRAALGQIAGSTEVRLRVPVAELDLWTEAVALLPNLSARPRVLAGEAMVLGECRIETALGTADLGVAAQLAEVERALLGNAAVENATAAQRERSDEHRAPRAEGAV